MSLWCYCKITVGSIMSRYYVMLHCHRRGTVRVRGMLLMLYKCSARCYIVLYMLGVAQCMSEAKVEDDDLRMFGIYKHIML
jgi:hypothetical protein